MCKIDKELLIESVKGAKLKLENIYDSWSLYRNVSKYQMARLEESLNRILRVIELEDN